jgi:hypothetical protein
VALLDQVILATSCRLSNASSGDQALTMHLEQKAISTAIEVGMP